MAKKSIKTKNQKTSNRSASNKRPAPSRASLDQALRKQLVDLLKGGQAHTTFDAAMGDWPLQLAGVKVANFPHTAWMLLEHMRIGQWDILEFSRSPKHVSPKWPEEYWPALEAPTDEKAWKASMATFRKDLRSMTQLVGNSKTDLFGRIPWGDGQTILREALLLADHNAYHLGQLVMLRKSIGI
ncbi:MAG: DinB family protein [Terriglobales bacterium]